MENKWHIGNAGEDALKQRGWLLGHFISPSADIRSTADVEVKWGIHAAGESRPEWTSGEKRTTLILLINGRFRVNLSVGTINLEHHGDYAIWGPGIEHTWFAEENSTVLTVRWPSLPS
ncbi:signal peptidase I [Polymorphospora sp. NPDC051019]|uniref:signal peptidase I n=1 Tax=Polymorphospora sp. NPDC051019 TaxID=3155725 RepID=UPI00343D0E23